MKSWMLEVFADLVCTGVNPEYADMDNPRGEIYGNLYYIRATDAVGHRRVLVEPSFRDPDEAGRFLHTLDEFSPNTKDWFASQPVYGSDAYISEGGEYGLMDAEELQRFG